MSSATFCCNTLLGIFHEISSDFYEFTQTDGVHAEDRLNPNSLTPGMDCLLFERVMVLVH